MVDIERGINFSYFWEHLISCKRWNTKANNNVFPFIFVKYALCTKPKYLDALPVCWYTWTDSHQLAVNCMHVSVKISTELAFSLALERNRQPWAFHVLCHPCTSMDSTRINMNAIWAFVFSSFIHTNSVIGFSRGSLLSATSELLSVPFHLCSVKSHYANSLQLQNHCSILLHPPCK